MAQLIEDNDNRIESEIKQIVVVDPELSKLLPHN